MEVPVNAQFFCWVFHGATPWYFDRDSWCVDGEFHVPWCFDGNSLNHPLLFFSGGSTIDEEHVQSSLVGYFLSSCRFMLS